MIDGTGQPQQTPHVFDKAHVRKKLRLAAELFRLAYEVKRRQLRSKYPELSTRELNHRAYALIERGCSR